MNVGNVVHEVALGVVLAPAEMLSPLAAPSILECDPAEKAQDAPSINNLCRFTLREPRPQNTHEWLVTPFGSRAKLLLIANRRCS